MISLRPNRFILPALLAASLGLATAHAQEPVPPASTATPAKPAPASAEDKARAEIQERLDKRSVALGRKDVAGAMLYVTPDFVSVMSDGRKMTLPQMRVAAQKTFSNVETVEVSDLIDTITLKGSTATVDMTEKQKIVLKEPTGITHSLNVQSQARCFWVKGKTGWLMKRARTLQASADLDGKPVRVATPG